MAVGFGLGCLPGLLIGLLLGVGGGVWAWIEFEAAAALDPLSDLGIDQETLTLDETKAYVDRLAAEHLADPENVGLVVGVLDGGESRVWGYGRVAQGSRKVPDGDTLFELASVGKTFTATVLADMHLRRELSWDDPLEEFLPDGVTVPRHGTREITLLDLATQTSGLPALPPNMRFGDPLNPYADYTVEELYAGLGQITLPRPPGEGSEYSNLGFGLLGHALARRADKSYEGLVVERICDPLGMASTRMTLDAALTSRLATPHDGGEPVPVWEDTTMPGAGSFLSTADDMLKYVAAHWEEPAEVGSDRHAALVRAMRETTRKLRPTDVPEQAVGLGWHIQSENALDIVWHNGGAGGSCSYVAFLNQPRVGVVVLSNSRASVDELGRRVLYLLARH
ncbi:MAG: serine hydrolase [Planctomycetaceae bacterium]